MQKEVERDTDLLEIPTSIEADTKAVLTNWPAEAVQMIKRALRQDCLLLRTQRNDLSTGYNGQQYG